MGRILVAATITNALDPTQTIQCDALVDTGAYGLVLPMTWRHRLGGLPVARTVELETADGRVVTGTVCGPVRIELAGFDAIFGEVTFLDAAPGSGVEALVGYTVLQQARAAVDMAHDRLVKVPHLDLKLAS